MYSVKSISLANLPTRIEKLENLSKELGHEIYIKRMTKLELKYQEIR